jgi:hypothetical protein
MVVSTPSINVQKRIEYFLIDMITLKKSVAGIAEGKRKLLTSASSIPQVLITTSIHRIDIKLLTLDPSL